MKRIYLSPPHISNKEQNAVKNALKSGWIAPMGSYLNDFTALLENYYNSNILLTNSGTSAIHLALKSIGIKENDIVLCSNFTFAATAFPILYEKAIPHFIGIEKQTWNISPEYLKKAIEINKKQNKKPKALLIAYSYGMPAMWDEIESICKENDIIIIEDAAEAVGSFYNQKPLGVLGDLGIISFNGNKIITCSTGGALISKDKSKIDNCRKIASQAKENVPFYQHNQVGYNYLQSNILAAIGYEQFLKLDKKVLSRRKNFKIYREILVKKILDFPKEPEHTFTNRWLSCFVFKNAESISKALEKHNIESRKLWNPLHNQEVFKKYNYTGDLFENELFSNGLCLPSGSNLKMNEIKIICEIIKSI